MSKNKDYNDLGLGSKASNQGFRALNKDGSFNVKKINSPFSERFNFFHSLISMSWLQFLSTLLLGYFIVNTLFASIYFSIGVEYLTGIHANTELDEFIEAFFFSAQTITTLGYGRVAPIGHVANTVAAVESMLGLLAFALATGLLYGRFSKPSVKIKYSDKAIIAPYQDKNAFMFKVVNPQNNSLLEVEVTVSASFRKENSDQRDFYLLNLERKKITFLPYTWTIVHAIDDESPLEGLNESELIQKDTEFIIMIKAFDESSSQIVYSRSSYKASEVKWGEKFTNVIVAKNNRMEIDISKLGETNKVKLN